MTERLDAAATAVAVDLHAAETAADAAAADLARLLATALEQRAASGAPIGTGAAFVRHVSRGLAAQMQAREEMVLAHGFALRLVGELDVTGYGDTVGCPPAALDPSGSDRVVPIFATAHQA